MFYAILKTVANNCTRVKVELKNDLIIEGNLFEVDENLNVCLKNITADSGNINNKQFQDINDCFIRGNTIRYIHFPKDEIDPQTIEEACKRYNDNVK